MTVHVLGPFEVPGLSSRTVRVCVPPSRPRSGPPNVLYMFDGQNLFDDAPSHAGGWHLHDAVERIAKRGKAPVIVGIDHGGASRVDELGPWRTERGGGRTDALCDWIVGSLMPRMEAEFGVGSRPEQVGIGGSSMGGLAAMYAHYRNPEKFGSALCMSPSFWFGRGKILEMVGATSKPWTSRVYLDAGAKEGPGLVAMCSRMVAELRAKGYAPETLSYRVDRIGTHNERHWKRRAPQAIRFLFARPARRAAA